MRLLLIITTSILYANFSFSQTQTDSSKLILTKAAAEQKLDSVLSKKVMANLVSFNLTDANKEEISAAVKHANELQRQTIENYWHTPSFYKQFNKGNQYLDSVMLAVLGKDRYMKYNMQIMQMQDKFETTRKLNYLQQKDSVNRGAHP